MTTDIELGLPVEILRLIQTLFYKDPVRAIIFSFVGLFD